MIYLLLRLLLLGLVVGGMLAFGIVWVIYKALVMLFTNNNLHESSTGTSESVTTELPQNFYSMRR